MVKPHLPQIDILGPGAISDDSYVLRGIAAYCRRFGAWRFRLGQLSHDRPSPPFDSRSADAIVILSPTPEMVARVADLGPPVVGVNSGGRQLSIPTVNYDNRAIGRMAAQHLLERGLRRFGFVGVNRAFSMDRLAGVDAAAAEAGCPPADRLIPLVVTSDEEWPIILAPGWIEAWLARLPLPVGIVAMNDIIGARVLEACQSVGLRVPIDVAVIGVDDVQWLCDTALVPLSSIAQRSEDVGYQTAAIIARLMDGQPADDVLIQPIGVVARRSTELLHPEHPELTQAVHFIQDHACDPITIENVLAAVPVSRRSLHRLFNQAYGRSPGEEIRRMRLLRAKKLLEETDLPIDEIARRCGFGWSSYLSRAFSTTFGTTPSRFRKTARKQKDDKGK